VEHADYMLALRINRANDDWNAYWCRLGENAAPAANQNQPAISRKFVA